jgi:predicted lipase
LTNAAGQTVSAGGANYTVVTTIYANDLSTDMNPSRGDDEVSIGLICQAAQAGDVVIAIRGTEGTLEWIHDAEFLQVPCPFLSGAGHTDDGFTAMYESLSTGAAPNSPSVVSALAKLPFPRPVSSVTVCGHSLGGSLATLLALDVAANTAFTTRPSTPMAVRARGIRCLPAPLTRWSRTRSGSQIVLTSCRRCLLPLTMSMCSIQRN